MAVGIIYAARSGAIRRVVAADRAEQLAAHLGTGEDLLVADASIFEGELPSLTLAQAAVAAKIGRQPEDSRCVIVDSSTWEVVDVILADPLLDEHADGYVIRDGVACVGWRLIEGNPDLQPPLTEE